jgi:predicted nucleotidyltransferase
MLKLHGVAADTYCKTVINDPNLEGIVYLGGLARGFADEFSDIDIALFSKKPMPNLQLGERLSPEGYDLEIYNIAMDEGFQKWTPIQKEAYEEGVVIYDKNNNVTPFLNDALCFNDDYRIKRSLELIFNMAWHGWIYTPYKNKTEKGYFWVLPEDLWFRRNHTANAFYVAQKSIEHYIELMFVINRKWSPDYKWRYIKYLNLPVLPKNAKENLDFLLYESWNMETWEKKRLVFQGMIDEAVMMLMPDLPDDQWYAFLDH